MAAIMKEARPRPAHCSAVVAFWSSAALALLAVGCAANVTGADAGEEKEMLDASPLSSNVTFTVSIGNLHRDASEVQRAFEELLSNGHVTVGFILPSTNAPSHTIEGLRSDHSIQSIKSVFQRMIQSSASKERVRFVMSDLSIEKGYLEVSNGPSHMRFLADGTVQSSPGSPLASRKLMFRAELKSMFVATSSTLFLALNNVVEEATGTYAPDQKYRLMRLPVVQEGEQLLSVVEFRVSSDFVGSVGGLRDISLSFH